MNGLVDKKVIRSGWPVMLAILLACALLARPVYAGIAHPAPNVTTVSETGPDGLPDDALIAPDLPLHGASDGKPFALTASSSSATPGLYQTSEYMIGRVAVGLFLLESDGSLDPSTEDWSADEIALVQAKIAAAAEWWAAREPSAQLSFVWDKHLVIPIPYEPIARPRSDQKLWIGAAMAALGYRDGDSYFTQVRRYVNDLRTAYQTDWAFAVFVIDDASDADKAFADGFSAYAYLGGPFMVLTLNNGGYGAAHLDAVAAHEMGHIFGAVDQYPAAGVTCTARAGYLGIENQNSQVGNCLSNRPSIMRSLLGPFADGQVDPYARGQVGWWDGDQNGILDPLDTPVELDMNPLSTLDVQTAYAGRVKITPYPSFNRPPVTINRIVEVLYRLDNGTWLPAHAQDGTFDGIEEGFTLDIPTLSEGIYVLDLLVRTWPGGDRLIQAADVLVIQTPGNATPLHKVTHLQVAGNTLTVNGWAAATQTRVADVRFQIDDGDWQSAAPTDGTFDSTVEAFTLNTSVSDAGPHTLRLQTVDLDGRFTLSEYHFAIETIHTVYLPLVQKP